MGKRGRRARKSERVTGGSDNVGTDIANVASARQGTLLTASTCARVWREQVQRGEPTVITPIQSTMYPVPPRVAAPYRPTRALRGVRY
eukprot:2174266-Rhodomonas_salina.1